MHTLLLLFLPLTLQLLILYLLSHFTNRLVMNRLGKGWYLVTQWPGVIVHELSHLFAAVLTFTRVHDVKLFAPQGDTLGYITHERTLNPLKNIFISIAPLFGVTAVMWLVVKFLMPSLYLDIISPVRIALVNGSSVSGMANIYLNYFSHLWAEISFSDWHTYLFLYLMIALSSHAAPSSVDLKHAFWGFIGLLTIAALVLYAGNFVGLDSLDQITLWITYPVFILTAFFGYSIVFSAISFALLAGFSLFVHVSKNNNGSPPSL